MFINPHHVLYAHIALSIATLSSYKIRFAEAGPYSSEILTAAKHRSRPGSEIANGYGQWSGNFYSPNKCLQGGSIAFPDGVQEFKRNWDNPKGKGLAKCSIFVGDTLFEAGLIPPMLPNNHYYLAGQFTECRECKFKLRLVDDAVGGTIMQLFGSAATYGTHIAILDAPIKKKKIQQSDIQTYHIKILEEAIRDRSQILEDLNKKNKQGQPVSPALLEELGSILTSMKSDYEKVKARKNSKDIVSKVAEVFQGMLKSAKGSGLPIPDNLIDKIEFELWDFWMYEADELRAEKTHRPLIEADQPKFKIKEVEIRKRRQVIVAIDTSITEAELNSPNNFRDGGKLARDPYMIAAEEFEAGFGHTIRFLDPTEKRATNWECPSPRKR